MKIQKEELSKTEVKLTIELSVEEVEPFIAIAAKRIAKEVDVKGFRKGKVPQDILIKHVGELALYQEALNDMIDDVYPKAIDQEKLQVVGQAKIDVEKLAPQNPVIFSLTVPLMPEVRLGEYKKLKTKKKPVEIDEKRYEKTMTDIRRMRASEVIVDRAAKMDDKVIADFSIAVDGVPIEGGQGTKQELILKKENFVSDFIEGIVGMKKGEEKDFEMVFPKEYHKKDLQNKKASVHMKVHDVYEISLPELTDDFAKELNFDSVEKLEEEMKANIVREMENEAQHQFENDVIQEIITLSEIDEMPSQLVEEEVNKMLAELRHDVGQQGVEFDDYLSHMKKTEEELREDFKKRAIERLQAALILRELAVAEKISVTKEDIDAQIEELRTLYSEAPHILKELDSSVHRTRMENQLIHQKLFEALEKYTA